MAGLAYVLRSKFHFSSSLTPRPVDAVPSPKYQKGTPGSGKGLVQLLSYENQKGIRILDLKYRPLPETAAAVVKDYEERGW